MPSKSSAVKIVLAQSKHLKPLTNLFVEAARYKIKHGDRTWRDGFSEAGVAGMIGRGYTYVAYLEGVLVGTIALEWQDDGWDDDNDQAGYIHRLAVQDGYHGQGLGTQIIDWATGQARLKGRIVLRLDCSTTNPKLCAYYESQSFTQVATKHFPDYNYTAAFYEKSVS